MRNFVDSQDMETKRKGGQGKDSPGQEMVEVVITPTPEEQQENEIVIRLKLYIY